MPHTVKPPRRKTHPPAVARDASVDARLDRLAADVVALRADVAKLRAEVHLIKAGGRKHPPPLPRVDDEVITVDEREVTLESIRPSRHRR